MIEYLPKQLYLLPAKSDAVVFGGSRGGGKTYGCCAKMALDVVEEYTESKLLRLKLFREDYRSYRRDGVLYFYKMLIDYPEYLGCCVRRTEPELRDNTLKEQRKIYPQFGGSWLKSERTWEFPSGASIVNRPCHRDEDLNYFQGQNFQRVYVGELTQFTEAYVDEIELCCRSSHEFIKKQLLYDCNPGKIGHKWVKRKYIDKCLTVLDGAKQWIEEYGIWYQSRKPGDIYTTDGGETYYFIPSTVFDNKYLSVKDKKYVRNLLAKNRILREMWLFGNWDVFAGQYFDMWDDSIHVVDEKEFYNASDNIELIEKKRHFDWSDYRLYRSFDYGFKAPWACCIWAVHNVTHDIIQIGEIYKSGLTSAQQARDVKLYCVSEWSLTNDDFEMNLADPKSYWKRNDTGDDFVRPKDYYDKEGIFLLEGNNDRVQGAMMVSEVLRLRQDGTPRLTILSNCINTADTIPNLPADENKPEDVDTKAEDHIFDAWKYFLTHILLEDIERPMKKKKGWRDKITDKRRMIEKQIWKVA